MKVYEVERFLEAREIKRNDRITASLAGKRKPPDDVIINNLKERCSYECDRKKILTNIISRAHFQNRNPPRKSSFYITDIKKNRKEDAGIRVSRGQNAMKYGADLGDRQVSRWAFR